jgi:hypothetical protein
MKQWIRIFLALGGVLQLTSNAAGLDNSGRPPIATDIERRFNGRFLFSTNGDGTYAIYQKVDRSSDIVATEDHICMMGSCYVAVSILPEEVLRNASADQQHTDAIRRSFKAGQDTYEHALRAPAPEKDAAMRIWREQFTKIGQCLRDRTTC